MGSSRIPVDLRNPGQVFACLGLMELTELLSGPATGSYEWSGVSTDATFVLTGPSDDAVADALTALRAASVQVWTLRSEPALAELVVKSVPVLQQGGWSFPFPPPTSSATLPARLVLRDGSVEVPIEHWGDSRVVGRDNVKFWAGMGGYAGVELLRDALELFRTQVVVPGDPFAAGVLQDSGFRFDWRHSYVPLDSGFSPNKHGRIAMVGFPVVEILAAIGLQHARPERPSRLDKLAYRYAVSSAALPTSFARAVLGAADLGFPIRRFHTLLTWPGKEGQARCIIDAKEEL